MIPVPGSSVYFYDPTWLSAEDANELIRLGVKGSLPGERPRRIQYLLHHAHRIREGVEQRGGFVWFKAPDRNQL